MKKSCLLVLFGFVCQWTLAQSPIMAPTLSNLTTSSIQVTWTPTPNTTYELERSAGGSRYSVVHEVRTGSQEIQPEQTFVSNGLSAATQYCFRLRLKGTSAYSGAACATTPAIVAVPEVPQNVMIATSTTSSITIFWSHFDGGLPATFEIEQATTSAGPFTKLADGFSAKQYTHANLPASTQYCYRVRAKNNGPYSAFSPVVCGSTKAQPAAIPLTLTAQAVSPEQINLTWNNLTGVTGYQLERSPNGTDNWTKITEPAAGVTTYSDQAVAAGTRYYYRIRSFISGIALVFGPYSNVADATTPKSPSPLTNLKAQAVSTTSIELTWDKYGKESGIGIERRTGQTGRWVEVAQTLADGGEYTDTGLNPNTEYCYRVIVFEGASEYSNVVCATTPDAPPAAPVRLSASAASFNQINLQWGDMSDNEAGFEIERSPNGTDNWTRIGNARANATTYSDQSVQPQTRYFYRVRASNGAGPSGYSNVADATTPVGPPAAPQNLAATATSTTQINLTWNTAANADNILIERSPNGNDAWTQITSVAGTATSYTDNGLTPNVRYYYRIRATNAGGAGPYSAVANALTPDVPPAAPARLTATAVSFSRIDLTWVDGSTNEAGFEIERSPNGNDAWARIADVGPNVTTYSNPNLNPRTRYFYRVRAVNAAGSSPYSNVADATTPDSPPAAPAQLTAAPASNSQINVQWTDGSDNETGFELERSADGSNWTKLADVPANATTYANTGLTPDTRYFYRVRAVNTVGQSAYSNVADVTTPDVPPAPPSRLTATAISPNQIQLTWSDDSRNESGFEVERSSSQTGAFTKIADVRVNTTLYVDTNLIDATQYCYRVRAKNAAGASAYTDVACATTPLAPPAAPTDLTAQVFDYDQIRLTWPGVSPKAVTVSIERSTDPNGGFTEIKQQPAQPTGYVDVGLQEYTTYYYRIRATNAAGNSAYSNVASARVEEIVIAVEDELETHTTLFVNQRELHVVTNWHATATTSIQLLTTTGQAVLTDRRKVNPADRWSYTLDALPTGLYIIHIIADGRRLAKRIMLP